MARWAQARFGRTLTWEDCQDAAAAAFGDAARYELSGRRIDDLEGFLRIATRNRTLSMLRAQRARGGAFVHAELDEARAAVLPGLRLDEQLEADDERRTAADAIAAGLERLDELERRVLDLREFDGLTVPEILIELGLTRDRYESLRKRALRKLRRHLAVTPKDDSCRHARFLVTRPATASTERWLDAHIAGCLHCQARTKHVAA